MKKSDIPKAIRHIAGIQRAPIFAPGIYFLISKGEIVYVGQSISPTRRIGDHISEGLKTFDDAFVFDVPKDALDQVEASFIALMKPKYNIAEGREVKATHASERTVDMLRTLLHGANLAKQGKSHEPAANDRPEQQLHYSPNRMHRLPDVEQLVGLKKSTIYKMMAEGNFPKAIKISPRCIAWLAADIDTWVRAQRAAQPLAA